MLNHYTLNHKKIDIENQLNISLPNDFQPIYNACVRKPLPIITNIHPTEAKKYTWGIIPYHANDPQIALKLSVANTKTIKAKAPYCDLMKDKRCIIIADSFFFSDNGKTFRVTTKNKTPFGIAGLYELSGKQSDGSYMFKSFAMIHCESSMLLSDRTTTMPVILPQNMFDIWLGESTDINALHHLLKPFSHETLEYYQVSDNILNPEINDISTITPYGETPAGQSLELF